MVKKTRVLVVEDSATTMQLLVGILQSNPAVEIVGKAVDGVQAVEMASAIKPDVIVMDVNLPRQNGLEATRQIMTICPTPVVIISAISDHVQGDNAMRALSSGAVAVANKPPAPTAPDFDRLSRMFLSTVISMSSVKVIRRHARTLHTAPQPYRSAQSAALSQGTTVHHGDSKPEPRPRQTPSIIAIAASVGGPQALQVILSDLPATLPVPILLVQHISLGFVSTFSSWLASITKLHVKVASHGELAMPGTVYLADEHSHLLAGQSNTVNLVQSAPVGGFRPSANLLFESVARHYRATALSIILTGMGHDGLEGLHKAHAEGGTVIAQDEDSSVVFGMPGAAVKAGLANFILPVEEIAPHIKELFVSVQ